MHPLFSLALLSTMHPGASSVRLIVAQGEWARSGEVSVRVGGGLAAHRQAVGGNSAPCFISGRALAPIFPAVVGSRCGPRGEASGETGAGRRVRAVGRVRRSVGGTPKRVPAYGRVHYTGPIFTGGPRILRRVQGAKVFWFFSSEKNMLS